VAEAREQFGNPEEREHLPLEADSRGLVKTLRSLVRAIVNCYCYLQLRDIGAQLIRLAIQALSVVTPYT
jgi:hypothetical protein